MDQVKHYLAIAGKHHFWILCALVAILTLGSWYTSSAKLRSEYESQKSKIVSAKSKAEGIQREQDHPNPTYDVEMQRMINDYKKNLSELWEKQYQEQGVNLQWPIETETYRGLTPEFVEQVKDLRPIETTVPYDPTSKGPDKLRDNFKAQYINFVKSTELPRLAKIIGAVWAPAQVGVGGGVGVPNPMNQAANEKAIVHWHGENQSDLQDKRFDWSTTATKRPSTLQILYAQEDLWVLETLINIIAKTNDDADARHNAVVKEIKYLKLGVDAVGLSGEVMKLEAATETTSSGYPTASSPAPLTPAPIGELRPGAAAPIVDPAEGRYVDVNYQPVPPGRLRDAFTSDKPEEAFLAVAKRMPVRMHLVVDQRYINRLLAECGNSNLIVEIRQVRVNRPVYEGGGASTGGGYTRGAGERPSPGGLGGLGGARRPTGGEAGRASYGRTGSTPGADEKPHHEVDIELYGIVYIYNPVNEAMVSAVATAGASAPVTPAPVAPPETSGEPPATLPPQEPPVAPPDEEAVVPAPVPDENEVPPAPVDPAPAAPME